VSLLFTSFVSHSFSNLDSVDLENKPFGRPQTREYLLRCASHWTRYISALLRSLDRPSPLLSLSPSQRQHFQILRNLLDQNGDIRQALQSSSFAMLSTYDTDVQRNSSLCPLMRFVVFWHLREDGTFLPPTSISPNIATLTFCFRTIAILEASNHLQSDPSLTFMRYVSSFSNIYSLTVFPGITKMHYFLSLRKVILHLLIACDNLCISSLLTPTTL